MQLGRRSLLLRRDRLLQLRRLRLYARQTACAEAVHRQRELRQRSSLHEQRMRNDVQQRFAMRARHDLQIGNLRAARSKSRTDQRVHDESRLQRRLLQRAKQMHCVRRRKKWTVSMHARDASERLRAKRDLLGGILHEHVLQILERLRDGKNLRRRTMPRRLQRRASVSRRVHVPDGRLQNRPERGHEMRDE